ncbi:MAG: tetratricopeptide repeat protein, partial [Deltaproteobacteria bacterium]|nr:tetratricopeptide repeat protein [Deltaproteobacteria bacterium]
ETGSQPVSPQPEKERKEDELKVNEVAKEKVVEEVKEDEPLDRAEHRPEKRKENVVERVRFGEHDAFSRIVFDLRREVFYSVEADPQENVVIISVPNCTLGPQVKSEEYGDSLIKKLVLSEKPGRVVVAKVELTDSKGSFTHGTLGDPHKIVFDVMPKVTEAEGEKSPLERGDRDSEKNVITEEKISQLVTPPTEEKIEEEEIKEEVKKEEVKEEMKEEGAIGEEDKLALSASSTTTTIIVPPRKRGEKQAVGEDEKRIFDSARELFRQEKYKEALSNLRYFMDLYPRSELAGPVSFLIGECYFHLAKEGVLRSYQPAVDAFQLALALYPDRKEAPGGLFQLANGYREMRYYYEAKENYEVLLDKHPNARCIPDAYFWIAENCFQNDEFKEAKDKFQNFMVRYPKKDPLKLKRASFRIADCYAGLKDYGRAQKGYEKALGRWQVYSGLFPETLFYMGLTSLKNGEYDKALSLLFTVLNVFPEQEYNHIVLTKIGDIYQMQGEVEEALKVYAQNSVFYPESKGALISEIKMADIGVSKPGFFKFGQYLDPLLVYQRVIEKYPTTDLAEEALYKQGFAFSEQKRYQEAIASLIKVLEEYTESDLSKKCAYSLKKNLYKLIDSYFSEEKYYPILEVYRKYKDPYLAGCKDSKALFQMGESFRHAGLYPEALEMYGGARRIYPRNHPDDELLLRMGEVYLLKKEYAGAEVAFRKLINNFPKSKFIKLAFHNLADTYYEKENYKEARIAYLSALEKDERIPRDIKGFFYLGKCYQEMGNDFLTIGTYKKAIQVAEDLGKDQVEQEFVVKSYFQLADYLYQKQKYTDAIRVYTQIAEKHPEDDRAQWALYRIAASYRKMGKEKVDIAFLKKLAEGEGEETFWEKVVSDGIRNLEWEVKNREHFTP